MHHPPLSVTADCIRDFAEVERPIFFLFPLQSKFVMDNVVSTRSAQSLRFILRFVFSLVVVEFRSVRRLNGSDMILPSCYEKWGKRTDVRTKSRNTAIELSSFFRM